MASRQAAEKGHPLELEPLLVRDETRGSRTRMRYGPRRGLRHYVQWLLTIIVLLFACRSAVVRTFRWATVSDGRYLIGVGKADITGPVVEINMMGYANTDQVGSGVRQRLYSRAFIVGDLDQPDDRFIYLVLDTQAGDTAVRYGILRGLEELGPEYAMYGHDNLAVTATHSHSGPGAWLNYLLPQITSKGFDKQSYQAIVDGCLLSIRRAHESLEPGSLTAGNTKVYGANINRSLYAYLANPAEERAKYNVSAEDDGSVEKDLTLLKFSRASDGKNIGVLTWFPTHGTSMLANNTLITGDNKGVAADLFEKRVRGRDGETDDFVAGFSQASMGDASPNTLGGWCDDGSGERCDLKTSSCSSSGMTKYCHARGPFFREKDSGASSCFEIGKRQYEAAMELYASMEKQPPNVKGSGVRAFHRFHDMSDFQFQLPNGSAVRTCSAALGYSFAAGTWDEPGHFDITQWGSDESNSSPVWKALRWLVGAPSEEQVRCQAPKPILLNVGKTHKPYHWTPDIVDIQTFRVGQFIIIVSPGEATTMAGRRWKDAVAESSRTQLAEELGGREPIVVLGGPSNTYTHYITTEEEYGIQRYEGASTLYGPHTLAAYIDRTNALLHLLKDDAPRGEPGSRETGPLPPDNSDRSFGFNTGVLFDSPSHSHQQFGDVIADVAKGQFTPGERVTATFVGANPRNNLRLEQTFAAVEHRRPGETEWTVARDDSDWGLIYQWKRSSLLLGTSSASVTWEIEAWATPGEYRLCYFGDAKSIDGEITAFEGRSAAFTVA
ncbi:Neutral/alkaline nonlysosomal ceramidase [Trichoderma citrinoviride]|uniref:Neutral ceramidase n=1 Tax=Trichoderma citrinoviride TaxID=58853 RepID=A0A2T4BFG0_9HYPO|nr:Neutral/alkaline nonlysosomal ceramidase [Trichoderma citrinoviride]PTB68070.1 Neutral/alkaline nonlysosomal ceramidase [Trichoderma citrinoviride]